MITGDELDVFVRSVRHATATHTGGALDAALDGLGWADALAADARTAISVLFEHQGRANVTSSALGWVLGTGLQLGTAARAAAVLPVLGSATPPGRVVDGGGVAIEGLGTAGLADEKSILVAADTAPGSVVLEVAPQEVEFRPVGGMDPSLGLVEVSGVAGPGQRGPADWEAALVLGRLAVAHELIGAARSMLDLARAHALERVQFGRPIAAFQAVRHRLADTLVGIEAGEGALAAAWEDRSPPSAGMAKAVAGRGARTAARHCQQVLAGIGYTTEHPFHHYLRRALVLDQLLGSTQSLTAALGDDLLRTGRVPPPPAL